MMNHYFWTTEYAFYNAFTHKNGILNEYSEPSNPTPRDTKETTMFVLTFYLLEIRIFTFCGRFPIDYHPPGPPRSFFV